MPRIVDHAVRRRELARAVWRVVIDQGVHSASVRTIAAESGWSAGSLRHYFKTQDELFVFALQTMAEQAQGRLRERLEREWTSGEEAALLIEELLPLDEVRLGEVLVWLAFADRARHLPELAHVRRGGFHGTAHVARTAVVRVVGAPAPAVLEEPIGSEALETLARRIQVLIDGWALQCVAYPDEVTADVVRRELRAEIATWDAALTDLAGPT